jgi:hypothetical protein
MDYPVEGSCQCGQVTYSLLEPPLAIAACHCKQCQRQSTSAFSITALVHADAVRFDGELSEWSRVSASGNTTTAWFCPLCGNHIYHVNSGYPDSILLKPATLADTSLVKPTMHVWVSEKQAWFEIPPGVVVFDTQPA